MRALRVAALAWIAAVIVATCTPSAQTPRGMLTVDWRSVRCDAAVGSPKNASDAPGFARNGFWKTDFATHCVPLSEIVNGGPSPDGIPPLDSPGFYEQSRAIWLQP